MLQMHFSPTPAEGGTYLVQWLSKCANNLEAMVNNLENRVQILPWQLWNLNSVNSRELRKLHRLINNDLKNYQVLVRANLFSWFHPGVDLPSSYATCDT